MLEFFLTQQKQLTFIKQQENPLMTIHELCEKHSYKKTCNSTFTQTINEIIQRDQIQLQTIPHFVPDTEFKHLFKSETLISYDYSKEKIFSLFTSELCDIWKDIMICRSSSCYVIRSGFYSCEYDIYESILLGFDAMFLYCHSLDKFKIQYFTEIARDFQFSILFIIHNKTELNTILETDAPYFVISGFQPHNFAFDYSSLFKIVNLIPKSVDPIAFIGKAETEKIKLLHDVGYKFIIQTC